VTLTLDWVIQHTVVHQSSSSIYMSNFTEIGKTFLWTDYQCFDAVGWAQEGHPACKKYEEDDGGWHWLVWMEWRPARWSVCLSLLIFPCTIKSRSSLLAPAHPGGPRKRAIKRLCVYPQAPLQVHGHMTQKLGKIAKLQPE